MAAIISGIDIDRPPGEVFSYVTDPSRFAEWQGAAAGVMRQAQKDAPQNWQKLKERVEQAG